MLLFYWLLGSSMPCFADLVVHDLDQFGKVLPEKLYENRVRYLKGLRLTPVKSGDPGFTQMLNRVNERLAEARLDFRIAVHVSKASQEWWTSASKMTLSDTYELKASDAEKRGKYLQAASAWDVIQIICVSWGTPNPLFFNSAVILSPEVGYRPETLKQHLQNKKRER